MLHSPHSHAHRHVPHVLRVNARRKDPTRTTGLRIRFEQDVNRRFTALRRLVVKAVVELDVFGLKTNTPVVLPGQFAFDRSASKVDGFMSWLKGAEDDLIFSVRPGTSLISASQNAWTNTYVESAYQKGLASAASELRGSGVSVSDTWLQSAFFRPVHADRMGLIFTRVYSDLVGITDVMDTQISRVLAQGIGEGRGVQDIARSIVAKVDGIGRARARTLARTEVIAAHATASLSAYREAGLEGVAVRAEWATAGDEQVCAECEAMEGRVFTLDEAEGMIPLHPNCRCAFIPVIEDPTGAELGDVAVTDDFVPAPVAPVDPMAFDYLRATADERAQIWNSGAHSKIVSSHGSLPEYVSRTSNPTLNSYVGNGYKRINTALREGRETSSIKKLRKLFTPTTQEYRVYRGIRTSGFADAAALDAGDTFVTSGLTSTARSPATSLSFAGTDGVLFQIRVPQGTRAIITNSGETEMILDHSTKIRITGKHEVGGGELIQREMVLGGKTYPARYSKPRIVYEGEVVN